MFRTIGSCGILQHGLNDISRISRNRSERAILLNVARKLQIVISVINVNEELKI